MKGSPTPNFKASHEAKDPFELNYSFQYEKDSHDAHLPLSPKAIIFH